MGSNERTQMTNMMYNKSNLQLGLHVHTGGGAGQGHAIVEPGHGEFRGTELEALGNCE